MSASFLAAKASKLETAQIVASASYSLRIRLNGMFQESGDRAANESTYCGDQGLDSRAGYCDWDDLSRSTT